jgi:EAL domain-containing protein (putative c-di-GMP-specific phosphodiesterase class I)
LAKHLNLTLDLDKQIVNAVLNRLAQPQYADETASINLFPLSTRDPGFIHWLEEALKRYPGVAPRIAFEAPEHGVSDKAEELKKWVARLSALGVRSGLDQVGKGFRSFSYLSDLKINYIKIDGSYARNIHENRENQFFVDSLVKYAHGLGIEVIAESVENREEWDMLKSLRVDGVKGFGVAKPTEWS